ncbi:adenine phosphoribosyltransferase [Corynebacterium genitalium ATCC 33030]|nr:adenine phosphoribosyltransferase [Corynebacterium pseudogenitalium]MCQ4620376.1 adenine phosphoribosyltransferase [Corynebacterium sp. CCUG 71335]MCQ4622264.1 adenine phosphoribosyltransferase [Corynebacterium sp. CCUG 70398]MCQ4627040.1 adenine phosphoribosyltransferase [Corynebacterium sp. CCUG 65737]UUA90520.1 adenine phosphoribosyltransferase [Corynebacterium genitalium ATCC 33030]
MRYVQDFPEEGVLFEDLTPVLADGDALHIVIEEMAQASQNLGADMIGGLDARGFLLGSAVAYEMGLGILAIRKKGKLPPPVISEEYSLEYGEAALEIPAEGMNVEGKRIVLVDDVLATGGTLVAARHLIERAGGTVAGCVVVLEVSGLGGRERLGDVPLVVINSGEPDAA